MAVTFQLPNEIETTLRRQLANLDQAAKEALLVEMYRQNNISHQQLASALGLSHAQTDDLVRRHQEGNGKIKPAGKAGDDNGIKAPPADLTPSQRVAAWQEMVSKWRAWGHTNLPPGHVVDDTRDSIYEGRGE